MASNKEPSNGFWLTDVPKDKPLPRKWGHPKTPWIETYITLDKNEKEVLSVHTECKACTSFLNITYRDADSSVAEIETFRKSHSRCARLIEDHELN